MLELTTITDDSWYVVDVGDNRERFTAGEDAFQVLLEPVNGEEYMQLERQHLGKMTRGEINAMQRAQAFRDTLITKRVKGVKGLRIRVNGEVVEPKDASQLCAAMRKADGNAPDIILDDIVEALKDHSRLARGLPEALRSSSEL